MYVKINGSDEKYYDIQITFFTTDKGNSGIVVMGDIPHTDKGFKVYEDDDVINTDLSSYVYQYGIWGNEYTNIEEAVDYGEDVDEPLPPNAFDVLSSRVSKLNSRVNAITPYVTSKEAYIGDTHVEFNLVYGDISVFIIDRDGNNIPYTIEKTESKIKVLFEPLEQVATVTISVQ